MNDVNAVDMGAKHSHYWDWNGGGLDGVRPNEVMYCKAECKCGATKEIREIRNQGVLLTFINSKGISQTLKLERLEPYA